MVSIRVVLKSDEATVTRLTTLVSRCKDSSSFGLWLLVAGIMLGVVLNGETWGGMAMMKREGCCCCWALP